METRAVDHPTGRGFVGVVQQVRVVFVVIVVLILRLSVEVFIICLFVFTEFTFSTTPGVR